jgi:hypothetical protein
MNIFALSNVGKKLKVTLDAIWKQYSAINAEGLKQASELLKMDLNNIGNSFKSQISGQLNGVEQGNSDQLRSGFANMREKLEEVRLYFLYS